MNILNLVELESAEECWGKLKSAFPLKSDLVLLSVWREKFEEMKREGNPFAQVYLDFANEVEHKSQQNVSDFMDMLKSHSIC